MRIKGKVGAVVVAAGESRRMGGMDKIFTEIGGIPILARVGDIFQNSLLIDEIVLVLAESNLERGKNLVRERDWSKVIAVCKGGARRQDSVKEGLKKLRGCQWVVIHDGARPFLNPDLIKRGLEEAKKFGAAVPAVPVKDTIKIVSENGIVEETPRRSSLWAVQTPQIFRFDLLTEAYQNMNDEVTDDATLLERRGHKVKIFRGSYDNMKITTLEDLALAEIYCRDLINQTLTSQ